MWQTSGGQVCGGAELGGAKLEQANGARAGAGCAQWQEGGFSACCSLPRWRVYVASRDVPSGKILTSLGHTRAAVTTGVISKRPILRASSMTQPKLDALLLAPLAPPARAVSGLRSYTHDEPHEGSAQGKHTAQRSAVKLAPLSAQGCGPPRAALRSWRAQGWAARTARAGSSRSVTFQTPAAKKTAGCPGVRVPLSRPAASHFSRAPGRYKAAAPWTPPPHRQSTQAADLVASSAAPAASSPSCPACSALRRCSSRRAAACSHARPWAARRPLATPRTWRAAARPQARLPCRRRWLTARQGTPLPSR